MGVARRGVAALLGDPAGVELGAVGGAVGRWALEAGVRGQRRAIKEPVTEAVTCVGELVQECDLDGGRPPREGDGRTAQLARRVAGGAQRGALERHIEKRRVHESERRQ